jgi:N-acetylmuramoyl-L-alanine amidase
MGISVLSWIVPFIKIEIIKEQVITAPKVFYFANVIADNNTTLEQEIFIKNSQFTWDNLLIITGVLITLFFIVRFVKSLWNVRRLIRQYPINKLANLYLVMTDVKGTPFSFFKYIFWNKSIDLNSEVGKKILAHEVAHVDENHSFDKLLIELQMIIGWYNPIAWLIRNELYLIHEFIADQKSIQNKDTSILAELLLTSAYPTQPHILSNSFFFSPIKRRIQMFKTTNSKFSYLRRLAILPIMAAIVLLFAFRNGNISSRPIIKLDKQYTVIIDAGHGGEDLGASAADGTTEKDLALAIALKVKSLNNNPNIKVILSREFDKFTTVVDKASFANAANANLFVSIHMDNDANKKGTGTTCYVPFKKNLFIKESTLLANNILAATNNLFPKSKLVTTKDKGIWVIENVNMPAVLFECGFISNPNDLRLVKENKDRIANMILDGIATYFSNNSQISKQEDIKSTSVIRDTSKDIISIKIESNFSKNIKNNSKHKVQNIVTKFDSTFTYPVENGEIINKLGYSVIPGSNNLITNNDMVTIKVPVNSTVKSINNGEVVFVGDVMGIKTVMIKHGEIYSTYNGITANVKKGQIVTRGQIIGKTNKMPNGNTAFEFGIADKDGKYLSSINIKGMEF